MADAQVISAVNAVVPGLTVTGILLTVIFWLLNGRIRSDREYNETVKRLEAERTDDQQRHDREMSALQTRCDRYESMAWQFAEGAKAIAQAAAKEVGSAPR